MSTAGMQHAPGRDTPLGSAPTGYAYEMRPLCTDAVRAEASALVEDRLGWLARRGLPVPARGDIPALFRDNQHEAAGLFEDDILLGCLILDRQPDLTHWGTSGAGPSLFVGHVHTLPGRSDDVVRLITLWASDHAARLGLPHVRAEALARHDLSVDPIARFLNRLQHMGWEIRGTGPGTTREQVARLELHAEPRHGLTHLIRCTIPLPPGTDRSAS
ncbi:hypothetical protein GCM10027074_58030 [Streptomyces deserti]